MKPDKNKVHSEAARQAIIIEKDLCYALVNYNTKFGKEMLINAIKKTRSLRDSYGNQESKTKL